MLASLAEAVSILVLAGLGIADTWRLSHLLRAKGGFPDVIGPDRYLGAISAGLLACGVSYLVSRLRGKGRGQAARKGSEGVRPFQVALVAGVLVLYVLAFPLLGYLLATVLFFPVTFFIFGVRPWPKSAWVGVLTAVLFYVIFFHLAEIPLPRGFLARVF